MRDRSPIWIGLADLLLCIVSVVIVAVAPTKARTDGIKPKAEFLITMESSVDVDADPDLWIVLQMLRQLNKDLGQTIVMITHNPEAVVYFDRVVHMRDGIIVDGIPADQPDIGDALSIDGAEQLHQPAPIDAASRSRREGL